MKSVASYFPANLEDADGNPIDASVLEGKIVGVFLSAHYCAGCKVFCPALVKFREKHKDDGFEVVFISRDENEKEKAIYVAEAGMEERNRILILLPVGNCRLLAPDFLQIRIPFASDRESSIFRPATTPDEIEITPTKT